jgi:hypothetical protein
MLHVFWGTLHTVGQITNFFKMTKIIKVMPTVQRNSVCVCFCVNYVGFLGFLTTSRLQDISNIMTYYFLLSSFSFQNNSETGFFLEISVILYSLIPSFIIMNNE